MIPRKPKGAFKAIAAGIVLMAGPASEGRAALSLDISLGAGVQLNDNLHLDPRTPVVAGEESLRQPVKETIFTGNPSVAASWSEGRDRLLLNYAGEYSTFQGDERRDPAWVHNIAADLNWRRWSPFFLEAREERSRVPQTQERDGVAAVDQVDRNRVLVHTGLVSEMGSRSTVEMAYRGELETYSVNRAAEPAADESDSGIGEFDRVQRQYGEALVRHSWNPFWESGLRVAYGRVDRNLTSDFAELRASLTVDQKWGEKIALRYRFEWRREDDDEPAGNDAATAATEAAEAPGTPVDTERSNVLIAAAIRGGLERGGSWDLAYQDGLTDQPDGDTLKTGRASAAVALRARLGSTLDVGGWHETRDYRISGREETAWGPTFAIRWMITTWSALDLAGSWTKTTIREEGLDEYEDRTTRAAAGLVLLLFKRVALEAGYGYRKNDSTAALRSYANNLVFALVTFHFKPIVSGRLPSSSAYGLIAAGAPSGGTADVGGGGGAADSGR